MSELTIQEKVNRLIKEHSKELKTQEQISAFSTMMMKNLLETALNAEMDDHLGYEKHSPEGHGSGNSRNGSMSKTLKGDFGEIEIETPRDREGTFEPQLIKKRQTRIDAFDLDF